MLRLPAKLPKKKRREARVRCPGHLAFVRSHGCVVPGCERRPIEAAHVRVGGEGGTGLKPGDDRTISLCAEHHRLAHSIGERSFAERFAIDLQGLATEFWKQSPHRVRWERKERAA